MTKKQKKLKESFNDEKARVRLYKSGKNWVKASITEINIMKALGLSLVKSKNIQDIESKHSSKIIKDGTLKTSAIIGGVLSFNALNDNPAFAASETPIASETSSNSATVAEQNSTTDSVASTSESINATKDSEADSTASTSESTNDTNDSAADSTA
ncbi:KxYKxGKxW signal peptide domain-containing protein, partial [Staphylococcus simulans]|uniref:KxYKxGKxW signal peptide domain-containing protein n=1 Tax=Staphylococcus simulans TaxID=1286 RepID=UPI0030BC24CB